MPRQIILLTTWQLQDAMSEEVDHCGDVALLPHYTVLLKAVHARATLSIITVQLMSKITKNVCNASCLEKF